MSIEATSALTFRDLILEVAEKLGIAYYGEEGNEEAQVPVDAHDLSLCKRHVNNGIRMFIADAPDTGWRWLRPTASLTLWIDMAVLASRTVTGGTYDADNDQTLITANSDVFVETMEEHTIVVTGQGSFIIKRYVSPTQVYVYGSHGFAAPSTYSLTSNGNFTMPRTFAGTFSGDLTFGPATDRAVTVSWTHEGSIRAMRENVDVNQGAPLFIAVSVFTPQSGRPRYQMMVYPTPDETFVVQFPYDLHFDTLTDLDSTPPIPIVHDDTIRSACRAVAERDTEDMQDGVDVAYYEKKALPNSRRLDARSAPRKLGYFGNGRLTVTPQNFRDFVRRPNVVYNTP